ncbi:MAG: hypothetical protein ACR2JN_06235 [Lapillicoccus sp.]
MSERKASGESVLGTVAQEAARLLDALTARSADAPACGHCASAQAGAHEPVCHLCPVCRLLTLVRAVRPETVDRLADLASAVTDSLRELAAARRADQGSTSQARPGGTASGDGATLTAEDEPAGGNPASPEGFTR